ncbi:MAG: VWA domain-containing protein [Treponema sp.]|nr:VWA domain-containing protein [Treponema sp.]
MSDQNGRARIAAAIYGYLLDQPGSAQRLAGLASGDTGTFAPILRTIVSNQAMRELCIQDALSTQVSASGKGTALKPSLAEDLTKAILDFINTTQRTIQKTESPFAVEQDLLADFEALEAEHFQETWEGLAPFIQETYEPQALDTAFYTQEFQKSLSPPRSRRKRKPSWASSSFAGVKEHFTERWAALLSQKQRAWEQECFEAEGKHYRETLDQRIEAYKNMETLFNPFPGEPRRLWDLSVAEQRVNFTVLHTYAKLLEQDPLVQDLANSLGRHKTEAEATEPLMEAKLHEPERLVEQASKGDLIGVRESDDLSSILVSEAALLTDETAQWMFYQKFAAKKLLTYAYRQEFFSPPKNLPEMPQGRTRKGPETLKGPFILCIDTSGSMRGIPETVAKTLCFALLKIALQDTRDWYLISFSTGMKALHIAETVQPQDLFQALDRLSEFLSTSFYGGTNAGPALHQALDLLETQEFRKADVLMVSDFIMPPLDEPSLARIKAAQERHTQFHSLLIGDQGNKAVNQAVVAVFDRQWVYEADIPELP